MFFGFINDGMKWLQLGALDTWMDGLDNMVKTNTGIRREF
jgi:hypothetical protein